MKHIICAGLIYLLSICTANASHNLFPDTLVIQLKNPRHLVVRLSDPDNGPEWRQKLVQDAQAPFDPKNPYPVIDPKEIADVLGLAEDHLNLDYFTATYGGTVKAVYNSQVLKSFFDYRFYQLRWYLMNQDPTVTTLNLPVFTTTGWLAYPSILNRFQSLQIINFYTYFTMDPQDSPRNLPFWMLFKTHPALSRVTTLNFANDAAPNLAQGFSRGLTGIQTLSLYDSALPTQFMADFYQLTNLQTLTYYGGLTTIDPACTGWKSMKTLDLSWISLTTLPAEFGQLVGLTRLNLSNFRNSKNYLRAPPEIFSPLTNLEVLDLSGNQYTLANFPFKCEPGVLPKLRVLNLMGSPGLEALPTGIGNLTSLTDLSINVTSMTQLPTSLVSLTSLTSLSCSANPTNLIPQIFSMTQLQQLFFNSYINFNGPIDYTGITNLRNLTDLIICWIPFLDPNWSLFRVTTLKSLFLANNIKFNSWPGGLKWLTGLTELDLSMYSTDSNAYGIETLTRLQSLVCYKAVPIITYIDQVSGLTLLTQLTLNDPAEISDTYSQLVNLEQLEITRGTFTSLPISLKNLKKLQRFNLLYRNYPDQNLGCLEVIYQIESLKHLNVKGTQAAAVSPNIQYLTNLETLNLSLVGLTKIYDGFGTLTNLRQLIFDHGMVPYRVNELPPSITNLTRLVYLDVSGLQLQQAPQQLYSQGVIIHGLVENK